MEALRSAYHGKKVFLTGHTGFKGSWLLLLLNELGAEVKGYSLEPEGDQALYHQLDGDSLCHSVLADIRDKDRLLREFNDFQPDIVIHMAAQALVLESYRNPVDTYSTNVMGTVHVLEAIRQYERPCAAVIITTDKVYENLERIEPYKEDERLGGFDPYSNSKACTELASSAYRLSFFHPDKVAEHQKWVATARSGNVIGGGDWSENRIVPDLVRALQNEQPLTMRNPHAVRPWQHVLDPLNGYLMLGARLLQQEIDFADAFNFGPDPADELTVQQLVEEAIACWGSGTFETPELKNKPHEAGLLKLDIAKARKVLSWEPLMDSKEAIHTTINWYKRYSSDPAGITREQIQQFFGA